MMFWQEDDSETLTQMPQDVVDVLFAIDCRQLPVDHAYALSASLKDAVPWLADDPAVAVHTVHVAGSQNGWERPEHGSDRHLILSRRTKLTLRVPAARIDDVIEGLRGKTLDVGGCALTVGLGKPRPLSKETTLFARYVAARPGDSEDGFLAWAAEALGAMGIRVRKALCGKETPLAIPGGFVHTRSLMLANLSLDESLRLQERGLGPHREMGCGIFIPHKGIDPVKTGN
jgi:CRISPR-associated protein Cas6